MDESADKFTEVLNCIITNHVPIKRISQSTYPVWYNSELISLIRTKKSAHCTFKRTSLLSDHIYFKKCRAKCLRLSRLLYKEHMEMVEQSLRVNPKSFWSYVKKFKNDDCLPSNTVYKNTHLNRPTLPLPPHGFLHMSLRSLLMKL